LLLSRGVEKASLHAHIQFGAILNDNFNAMKLSAALGFGLRAPR
jgi:hypothetical protein